MNYQLPKPLEFDRIKTGFRRGQNTRLGYSLISIPAKPPVQTKLKRGGFFFSRKEQDL
jgi:hypothetical protein